MDFKHVYHAMKLSRLELQRAIENTDPVYFDAVPIDYKNEVNTVNVVQLNESGSQIMDERTVHITQSPDYRSKWLNIAKFIYSTKTEKQQEEIK